MGNSSSATGGSNVGKDKPSEMVDATLYYFAGRGRADQIRWVLAATGVTFENRVVATRDHFVRLSDNQLPFRQLPMLQIDHQDFAQSQAIIRYLAKRANIAGNDSVEEMRIDMIAEAVNDTLPLVIQLPFIRKRCTDAGSNEELVHHEKLAKVKWLKMGTRLDSILKANGGVYLVGNGLSYADILVAHMTTWFVEEFGSDILNTMNFLISHQCMVISLPGVDAFIKSSLYYPIGDQTYVDSVNTVLGR